MCYIQNQGVINVGRNDNENDDGKAWNQNTDPPRKRVVSFFFIQSFVSKILFGPVFIFKEAIPIIKPRLDAKFAYSKVSFFDVNLSWENYRCNKDTKHFLQFL